MFGSVHERFRRLLGSEELAANIHSDKVRAEVVSLLETMCGLVEGTRVTTVSSLFSFTQPALVECVHLLGEPHGDVKVCMRVCVRVCVSVEALANVYTRVQCTITLVFKHILFQKLKNLAFAISHVARRQLYSKCYLLLCYCKARVVV